MRRLVAALLIASLGLLGAAVSARSQPQSFNGSVSVAVKGWGDIKATKGAIGHPTVRCTNASCPRDYLLLKRPRVVLTEKPYMGWKFTGWRGACKSKRARCVLDASHAPKDSFGEHSVHVRATFIPVAPGLTRAHPIPLGAPATIADGLVVRVNSANANVQLGTSPPAGAEYFDANLTATNPSDRSKPTWWYGFTAEGSDNLPYGSDDGNECSDPGPQPPLDTGDPLNAGQSTTGYVCWTIYASDANSLELYFGLGTLEGPPRTTWFALH
ncbi:MAG: hypothetical protein ACXVRV_04240 [Gaiellaceae bacterium]